LAVLLSPGTGWVRSTIKINFCIVHKKCALLQPINLYDIKKLREFCEKSLGNDENLTRAEMGEKRERYNCAMPVIVDVVVSYYISLTVVNEHRLFCRLLILRRSIWPRS